MNNRTKGKKAEAYGAQFERLLEISCRQYSMKGIAHIQKTPEPFNMVGKRGKHVFGFYEKKAQPDFAGTLKGGCSIVFEAKHTNTTNIAFNRVAHHQARELDRHEKLGAVCMILVGFKLKHYYAIPWGEWKRLKEETTKRSANQTDLAEFKVRNKNGLINFLGE